MRVIVTSRKDIAGSSVYLLLSKNFGFKKVGEFENSPTYKKDNVLLIATEKGQVMAEHLDNHFTADYYIFASRHRSVSGERTLTVHTPGNLTEKAEVGGNPMELAFSAPCACKAALMELNRKKNEFGIDYKVSMEVTHHGPTSLKAPVIFVEVGSTEEEWRDPKAVEAVSNAAIAAAMDSKDLKKGVGIGGNHYAPRHTRFILESNETLGHLIPSYALDSLSPEIFREAALKSSAEFCFLDWKGMTRDQREKVMQMADDLGIKIRRNIFATEPIIPEGFKLYRVQKDLFIAAEKIDSLRLKKAIKINGCIPVEKKGHLTGEFWASADVRGGVVKVCMEILAPKEPVLEGNFLFLYENRFDPYKALKLGLKPGPDYSLLKKDETINLGDRIIRPEDVISRKKTRITLDAETVKFINL